MTCRRVWEAEAIEDGRLDASSIDSFERHAAACTDCANAVKLLTELREARALLHPRRLSPFEHRRKRSELLRRANSAALRPSRHNTFFVLMFTAAALVALVVLVRVDRYMGVSTRPATPAIARQRPSFELRPVGVAEWHDATEGPAGHVVLARGTLGLHVEHLTNGQRFVVALPDGELEVRGTRFIVEVKDGHTERVLVTEGVVSLRLKDGPERVITGGESYIRTGTTSVPVVPSTGDIAAPEAPIALGTATGAEPEHAPTEPRKADGPSARSAPPRPVQLPARDVPPTTTATGSRSVDTSTSVAVASGASPRKGNAEAAGEAFHVAMAAFSLGEYAEADERFAEFAAHFPGDSRDEDAAFLRTVIALRRGDPAAALVRARAYLRRFPDGLRRQEMERMLEAAKSP